MKTSFLTIALLVSSSFVAAADGPPLNYKDVQVAQKKSMKEGDVVFDPFEGRQIRLNLTPIGKSAPGYYYVEKKAGIIFSCVKPQAGYSGGDTFATIVGTNANEGVSMQLTGCRPASS